MRLAISNIAWSEAQDPTIAPQLLAAGAQALEVAPGRIGRTQAPGHAAGVRALWESRRMPIVSMQSLLFNVQGAALFGSRKERDTLVETLGEVIGYAGELGCKALVFGSPKNRLKGALTFDQAVHEAAAVFRQLGDFAAAADCSFCVEANATAYGCDFVTGLAQAQALVDAVDHPNVNMMIDTGNMELAGETARDAARISARVTHLHISRPQLAPVDDGAHFARSIVEALASQGYSGTATIEMRAPEGDGSSAACHAVETVRSWLDG